jgi:hypothetical protein
MKKSIFIFILLYSVLIAFSQTKAIAGKVTDEKGFSISDESVTIQETQSGVSIEPNVN